MKKGQMEILGLAVVVVIILVAAVFVVRFGFNKPTNYRTDFLSSEISSNMLNTFLKTTARDCSLTMTELLQDCAQGNSICCLNCDGSETEKVYSCKYAESTANEIFSKTLDKWKMKYEFSAYADANSPLIRLGIRCSGEKDSSTWPIPISAGSIYIKLDICR